MTNETGLTFRRINGRIVPIKQKQEGYANIMGGSGKLELTAAAGTFALSDYAAKKFRKGAYQKLVAARRAERISKKAFMFGMPQKGYQMEAFAGKLMKGYRGSKRNIRFISKYHPAIVGGLGGAAIQSFISSKVKEPSQKTEFAMTVGSIIGGVALAGLNQKLRLGSKALQTIKSAMKLIKRK